MEGLEWLSPDLDSTQVHQLPQEGLCCLVWMCTRLKPATRIADLRALDAVSW
eukprot:Skav227563  [mRNA]  locus=scaffold154:24282:24437:- [translate_table: standard]